MNLKNARFVTGLKDGNKLYTVEHELGLLMEYDLHSFSYTILAKLGCDKIVDGIWRVKNIIKKDNVFYLAFLDHDFIMSYDIDTDETEIYGEDDDGKSGIEKCLLLGNEMWLLPSYINKEIKVFDVQTKCFTSKFSLQEHFRENGCREKASPLFFITYRDGVVYAFLWNTPYLISIDVYKCCMEVHEVGPDFKIESITSAGKDFWISFVNNCNVVKWGIGKGIQEQLLMEDVVMDERKRPISNLFEVGDKLFLIPNLDTNIYSYEKNGMGIKRLYAKRFNRDTLYKAGPSFSTCILKENKLIMFPLSADRIILIDLETGETTEKECVLQKEDAISWGVTKEMLQKGIVEKGWFSLEDFIKHTICSKNGR